MFSQSQTSTLNASEYLKWRLRNGAHAYKYGRASQLLSAIGLSPFPQANGLHGVIASQLVCVSKVRRTSAIECFSSIALPRTSRNAHRPGGLVHTAQGAVWLGQYFRWLYMSEPRDNSIGNGLRQPTPDLVRFEICAVLSLLYTRIAHHLGVKCGGRKASVTGCSALDKVSTHKSLPRSRRQYWALVSTTWPSLRSPDRGNYGCDIPGESRKTLDGWPGGRCRLSTAMGSIYVPRNRSMYLHKLRMVVVTS